MKHLLPIVGVCVAVLVWSVQAETPPELLQLARIKQKMKLNLAQIPNYTCLETITRSRRWPRRLVVSRDGGPGPFRRRDSLRLEVAKVGKKELFSAAGARKFEDADLGTFARGGLIGNGAFALFAYDIFVNGLATYHFVGREKAQGRDLLHYDYEVSYLSSGYRVKSQFGEEKVAYRGAFWADPRTLEAVRIDVRADEIPPHLRIAATTTRIDYATVRIGSSDVLLPQSGEMTSLDFGDNENLNQIEFTHCKQYGAESVISFDVDNAATGAGDGAVAVEFPAGVSLMTSLETPVDLETTAVGDLITARMQADVRQKGRVIIPKGALISGRIRRLERYTASNQGEQPSPHFVVALEFSDVDFTGNRVRFFAEMERVTVPPGLRIRKIATPSLPGVGTFSVEGGHLLTGLRMVWKTVAYASSD